MKTLALVACLCASVPAAAQEQRPTKLVEKFMAAWNAADATALADLFAPGADFVSPDGTSAKGRSNIEAFYAGAFARGYAGSQGLGEVVNERALSDNLVLIDARFTIHGAHTADGSVRSDEKGILAVVLARDASGWHIVALRENEGASDLRPLGSK